MHSPKLHEPQLVIAAFYVMTYDLFLHEQRRGASFYPEP